MSTNDEGSFDDFLEKAAAEEAEDQIARLSNNPSLGEIGELAQRLRDLKARAQTLEGDHTATLAEINHIETVALVQKLQQAGLRSFELMDGGWVGVEDIITGGLPAKNPTGDPARVKEQLELRERALNWLEANGHGGVVKLQLIVELAKGDDEAARRVQRNVADLPEVVHTQLVRDVHAATMKSLLKELVTSGNSPPAGLFNVFVGSAARLSATGPVLAKRPKKLKKTKTT